MTAHSYIPNQRDQKGRPDVEEVQSHLTVNFNSQNHFTLHFNGKTYKHTYRHTHLESNDCELKTNMTNFSHSAIYFLEWKGLAKPLY